VEPEHSEELGRHPKKGKEGNLGGYSEPQTSQFKIVDVSGWLPFGISVLRWHKDQR